MPRKKKSSISVEGAGKVEVMYGKTKPKIDKRSIHVTYPMCYVCMEKEATHQVHMCSGKGIIHKFELCPDCWFAIEYHVATDRDETLEKLRSLVEANK